MSYYAEYEVIDKRPQMTRADMNEDERAIFGARGKGPLLAVLACGTAVGASLGMLYVLQQFWS